MNIQNQNSSPIFTPKIWDEKNRDLSLGGKSVTDSDYTEAKLNQQLQTLASLGKSAIISKSTSLTDRSVQKHDPKAPSQNVGGIDKFINNEGFRINVPTGSYEYHTGQRAEANGADAIITQKNSGSILCKINNKENGGFDLIQGGEKIATYNPETGYFVDKNAELVIKMAPLSDGGFAAHYMPSETPAGEYHPKNGTVLNGWGDIVAEHVSQEDAHTIITTLLATDIAQKFDDELKKE
ncbi:hypothetical protein IJ425_02480 [bacterium]|nr:hypothetical protein [bacterium]